MKIKSKDPLSDPDIVLLIEMIKLYREFASNILDAQNPEIQNFNSEHFIKIFIIDKDFSRVNFLVDSYNQSLKKKD